MKLRLNIELGSSSAIRGQKTSRESIFGYAADLSEIAAKYNPIRDIWNIHRSNGTDWTVRSWSEGGIQCRRDCIERCKVRVANSVNLEEVAADQEPIRNRGN